MQPRNLDSITGSNRRSVKARPFHSRCPFALSGRWRPHEQAHSGGRRPGTVSLVNLHKLRKSHAAKFQVDHDAHQSTASPAEREQRYQQVLRELRDPKFYQIRITGMLLKRGYLWPNERDDLTALRQAVILFIWDTLRKKLKPNRKTEDKEIVRTRPCAC